VSVGERFIGLLIEPELGHAARLVPTGIVVIAGRHVQAQLHVIMRPDPFGGIDHASLESPVDVGARNEDRRAAGLGVHLAA
jgi:hypothetical protein